MERTRGEKIHFLSSNLDTRSMVWESFTDEELDRVVDALWVVQECERWDREHQYYEDE